MSPQEICKERLFSLNYRRFFLFTSECETEPMKNVQIPFPSIYNYSSPLNKEITKRIRRNTLFSANIKPINRFIYIIVIYFPFSYRNQKRMKTIGIRCFRAIIITNNFSQCSSLISCKISSLQFNYHMN